MIDEVTAVNVTLEAVDTIVKALVAGKALISVGGVSMTVETERRASMGRMVLKFLDEPEVTGAAPVTEARKKMKASL
jgi:riboflavin synthase alpha subunit